MRSLVMAMTVVLMLASCGDREEDGSAASTTMPLEMTVGSTAIVEDADTDLEAALPAAEAIEPPSDLTVADTGQPVPPPATTAAPTTPGTFSYAVTGAVNGESVLGVTSLTVSDPDGAGRQSHTEQTAGGTTTTVYRVGVEGRYLESITIEAGSRTISMSPDESLLLVPAGARGGTTTGGRVSGDDAVAEIQFTLVELDAERMIFQTATRLAARIGPDCLLTGTITTTSAARTTDQLPLDVRAESEMETSGSESCTGTTRSQTRSLLTR